MKHEIKKITKIVDEILTYFMYAHDARNAQVQVHEHADGFDVSFLISDITISAEDLEALEGNLGINRNPELEDYYWQLAGEMEDSSELSLVAMMTDLIELTYESGDMKLVLRRRR